MSNEVYCGVGARRSRSNRVPTHATVSYKVTRVMRCLVLVRIHPYSLRLGIVLLYVKVDQTVR
jgi:hypothetical protein